MADPHDKLRRTLAELREQLSELRARDPALASNLESTLSEAEEALAGDARRPAEQESISKRLSDAVLEYEATHPSLAGNLGSIIDALARMGI